MFSWIIGIPLLTLFAAAGLALVVIPSSRGEPGRPTLKLLLLLIALWTFSSVMVHSIPFPSTVLWLYFLLLCAIFTGAVGVHFSIQFVRYSGWKINWLVRILYVWAVLLSWLLLRGQLIQGATLLPDGSVDVQFGPMAPFMWGTLGFGALLAIGFLLSAIIRSSQPDKKHTLFPLLGYMVMCLGTLSNSVISSYPIDIAANLVFVSLLSYGVTGRHQLRPSIKLPWHLILPVTVFLLMLCYVAMLIFCQAWLGYTLVNANIIAGLTTLIFYIVMFGPVRKSLLNVLERWLFPNTHRYQQALSKLASLESSLIQWESNVIDALNIITEATCARGAVLLLRKEKLGYFEAVHATGNNIVSMLQTKLPIDSPLVTYLDKKDVTLSSEEVEQYFNMRVVVRGEDDSLRELGSNLYCAIQDYSGTLAILAVTRSSREGWYEDDARDFLKLASHQIATNIMNAGLYQTSQWEIRERKLVEEKLKISHEQLRNLSLHLQMVREEERTYIAREIHDELGQALTALKMELTWVSKRLPTDIDAPLIKINSMLELIDTTIQKLRRIASELRPAILDDLGLVAAIDWQVSEFQNHMGIKCLFSRKFEEIEVDKERAITTFRTLQEALTNVARHAHATKVIVKLEKTKGKLVLTVKDNGRGVKKEEVSHPRSFGLIGMRERVHAFEGEVTISGIQDKGTTVLLSIPLKRIAEINDKSIGC